MNHSVVIVNDNERSTSVRFSWEDIGFLGFGLVVGLKSSLFML